MKENNIIKLRGHHLLCLQGYQGYGYDSEFEKNMTKIHKKLNITTINDNDNNDYTNNKNNENNKNKNNNIKIIVGDTADDLCAFCPNLKEGICAGNAEISIKNKKDLGKIIENNNHIIKLDSIVLKKSKVEKNKEYYFEDLISSVNNAFRRFEDVQEVCKDCKWIKQCLWYQSRK